MRLRALLPGLALAVLVPLAGCSGSGSTAASPRQVLAAARHRLEHTSGVHLTMSTPALPSGTTGLVSADGVGTHAPAFSGTLNVAAAGITADVAVVAVHGKVWAKLPFTTRFARVDPAQYGAPDPARLLAPDGGLGSLLTAARDLQQGKQQRDGHRVLRTYTGTVPGSAVASVLPTAASGKPFDATFTVDSEQRLDRAVLTGPFYAGAGPVTYTVSFDHYGLTKKITAP